jgi:hypothetical protein
MSPNEKSVRLHALAVALKELRKEATRLDEGLLAFHLATAADEARKAAERAITRA